VALLVLVAPAASDLRFGDTGPPPLWEQLHGSSAVVLAQVEVVELVPKPGDDPRIKVVLRVREAWKGTTPDTIALDLSLRGTISSRPPLYDLVPMLWRRFPQRSGSPGASVSLPAPETIVAFLHASGPRAVRRLEETGTLDLSFFLRARSGEVDALRDLITSAVVLQGKPSSDVDANSSTDPSDAIEQRFRRQALALRATRARIINEHDGVSVSGSMRRDARSPGWSRGDQQALAEGFVRQPALDGTLPEILLILRSYRSKTVDEMALARWTGKCRQTSPSRRP
jgi:hypothetical protein